MPGLGQPAKASIMSWSEDPNALRRLLGLAKAVRTRREEGSVVFVGELTGSAESLLQAALTAELVASPKVARAYLARVAFETDAGEQPALCLRGPEDIDLVRRVGQRFAELFGRDQHMDILFLTEELESQVELVCRPFYAATPRHPAAG